jgi:hypothetical protein
MGGGGGGGGVIDGLFPVVPGTTYTVTIGTGGAGANTSAAAGSNGTDTTFGSLFTAPGGQGGTSYNQPLGTGYAPASNPGGSMGGWGNYSGGTLAAHSTMGGHGCGAGTPSLPAAKSDASSVGDVAVAATYTYFDGYVQKSVPCVYYYESSTATTLITQTIAFNTVTSTTAYRNVKRNDIFAQGNPVGLYYNPGLSYKGLGAGGQSLLSHNFADDYARSPGALYIEPSAGKVLYFSVSTTSGVTNGTNGLANTGAGGGGSRCGGTNNTVASGGAGGSGYVEVVWVE